MKYFSTRGEGKEVSASAAILSGLADDGGLYVPAFIPKPDKTLEQMSAMGYQDLAYEILKLYLTDFSEEELRSCIISAYDEKFDTPVMTPVVQKGGCYFLELFHGKTLAFKDMALSILPYFLTTAARKNGQKNKIVILTATSGDTGKAALEGFKDVEGTEIIVFFPENGVSPVQKQQMVTSQGKNVHVVGVTGNFDDTQTAVKDIFTDAQMAMQMSEMGFVFSSANSINIGRLVPQIVYYFYAYFQMVNSGSITLGDEVSFTVPTGNFGNILAGYYAKHMGLPISKLICASNENKVIYDFFTTGVYDKNRDFVLTASPSMDILISSNLERLLYHTTESSEQTSALMAELQKTGSYRLKLDDSLFAPSFATEDETFQGIKEMYENGYIIDTHTSVAYMAFKKYASKTGDRTKNIIVSTASPFKFTESVCTSIDKKYDGVSPFELLDVVAELGGVKIPEPIKGLRNKEILHKTVCDKEQMKDIVLDILK